MPLRLPPIAPSAYQQALDQGVAPPQLTTETVRFWSDYNHIFYHPRSIVQLNEYELNSSLMPFESWTTGEELFAGLDREHDLLDRDLRPFLEECDQLQALQIFASADDAWGGFTSRYLERITDDLGKGCRWVFGLTDGNPGTRGQKALQLTNLAQSLYSQNSSSSVQIPLTSLPAKLPGYLSMSSSSAWHTSALQAAAVESILLPARLRTSEAGRMSFDQLEAILNNDGKRRLAAAALSVDDPNNLHADYDNSQHHDVRMVNGISNGTSDEHINLDLSLVPAMHLSTNETRHQSSGRTQTFNKVESLRGPWLSDSDIRMANAHSRDPFTSGPRGITSQAKLLFPILSSYPHIFRFAASPQALAVKTTLSTSSAVAEQVRALEANVRHYIAIDEREALCDGLNSMAEEYEEGWTGTDDSDDND